jgi:hypothetical protein
MRACGMSWPSGSVARPALLTYRANQPSGVRPSLPAQMEHHKLGNRSMEMQQLSHWYFDGLACTMNKNRHGDFAKY